MGQNPGLTKPAGWTGKRGKHLTSIPGNLRQFASKKGKRKALTPIFARQPPAIPDNAEQGMCHQTQTLR